MTRFNSKVQTPVVQLSTRIDPKLAKQVRVYAAQHGVSLQDLVTTALRAIIEK